MAVFTGMGLVAIPRRSRARLNILWCRRQASFRLLSFTAFTRASMSPGTILPTTETIPLPPMDIRGRVRLSSPLSRVRLVVDRIWLA